MDLGYSYRYGTESFLKSYTYRSATGADADDLWNDAVAETGLGEMDAITRENVKWMMSYIADYTGEIPGSLFMALQTYIWDNQSDKSAGGDPSGDIDAGGFANADTYDQYVEYTEKNGQRLTLERECLRSASLPSIAYGHKKCSLKHKVAPQEKFCAHYPPCQEVWDRGEKAVKLIGYDAGEEKRRLGALPHDLADRRYQKEYPLMEWGWDRNRCIQEIRNAGLPLPGKSSCFFCPSMKRREIRTLYHRYPDLLERALAIEDRARPNLLTVRGLGRNYAWRDFIEADQAQLAIPEVFAEDDLPCSCGGEIKAMKGSEVVTDGLASYGSQDRAGRTHK